MLSKKLASIVVMLGLIGSASATLNYEYYEAPEGTQYKALADVKFGEAEPNMIGTSDTLNSGDGNWIEQADGHRGEDFAFRFFGDIVVPISGKITFYLRSDDGSQIFIDDQMVVDNDGLHGTEGFPGDAGAIILQAGAHTIDVIMFERGGGDSVHVAWSAGGQAAVRVPDSVLFLEATPEDIAGVPASVIVDLDEYDVEGYLKASNPTPADGTVEAVDATVALLSWDPGYGAVSYDVYISADAEIDATDFAGTVTEPNYAVTEPVVPGVTYFWRVDATDADKTYEGNVWQITAMSDQAHYPMPADADLWSLGITTELSWTPGVGAMVHNVYFSTDQALVDARDPSVATMFWMLPSLAPGELVMGTTYYWAVDEFSAAGTVAGPTWSFSAFSFDPVPVTDESLVAHYTFEEIQGGLVNDLSGHEIYGTVIGDPILVYAGDNYALSLDGTQCVDLGLNEVFNPAGSFSIAVWANAASWGNSWGHAMMGNRGESGIGWQLRKFGGNPTVSFTTRGIGDDDNPQSTVNMPLNEWVHVSAVYDNANNTKTLYFNGGIVGENVTNPGTVNPTTHNTYIGARANGGNTGPEAFFDGLLDDVRFYSRALSAVETEWIINGLADITGPNDMVQGVPNEVRDGSTAGWPDGEAPKYAIDNLSGEKFLHFAGEVVPTGIQIAPAAGTTVVTGLTLTTANDAPERDPITYELSGSNESIDGPFELIASGDIVDFNDVNEAAPRFSKTTIAIDNAVAYDYYQVLFPTVRDAGAANSMQIAEIELIGGVMMIYGFDDLPDGDSAINGVHGGIDFGTDSWWGGDSWYGLTKCGYFYDNYVDVDMSFNLPSNTHLVSLVLSSDAPYSYTISDGVNEDIVGTTGTLTPEVINTNWTNGGATITINTEGGWYLVLDDITYIVN